MADSRKPVIGISAAARRYIENDIENIARYLRRPGVTEAQEQALAELLAGNQYIKGPKLKSSLLDALLVKPLEQIPDDAPQEARESANRLRGWLGQFTAR